MSPLIPDAVSRGGNDPIFSLHAEAVRRARNGESVVNATLGALLRDDGRLAVMPSVLEAFDRVPGELAAAYAPIAGDPAFLEAVVEDVFGGSGLSEHAVAVATPGGTGAIQQAVMNFLEPGQSALTSSFFWGSYSVITGHAGRSVDTFEMFGEDGGLDLDAFERGLDEQLARQARALVLFNFPCHNPTGYSLDVREWSAVADIVARAGARGSVTFLLDHAYARFGNEASEQWIEHVPRMLETATVLVAWTVSKSLAQYGARVGGLVALHADPDERRALRGAMSYSCRATWSNCNHRGILAVTDVLTDPDLRECATAERGVLIRLLGERVGAFNDAAGQAGLRTPRYEGGFFVSVFTPDGERTAAVMRDAGVFVLPMQGAVRVALCATPVSVIQRVVEALVDGVAAAEPAPGESGGRTESRLVGQPDEGAA